MLAIIKPDIPDVQSVVVTGFKDGLVRNTNEDLHYLLAVELAHHEVEDSPGNMHILIMDHKGEDQQVVQILFGFTFPSHLSFLESNQYQ